MQHIHYLSDNTTICWAPHRLGGEFIRIGSDEAPRCKECSSLLLAHNMREAFDDEVKLTYELKQTVEPDLGAFKGFVLGVLVSSVMWIVIILLAKGLL